MAPFTPLTPVKWIPHEPLAKLLGLRLGAVLNAPGERASALDRRLDAWSGGPAARRKVEIGCFTVFSAPRGDTGGWLTPVGGRGALSAALWLCH